MVIRSTTNFRLATKLYSLLERKLKAADPVAFRSWVSSRNKLDAEKRKAYEDIPFPEFELKGDIACTSL
jgi:hypothetical protein